MPTKPQSIPGGCCLNCHFLAKWCYFYSNEPRKESFPTEERQDLVQTGDPGLSANTAPGHRYVVGCFHDVWAVALRPWLKDDKEECEKACNEKTLHEIRANRKERCFFYPHSEGMSFDAACTLEGRASEQREGRRLTMRNVVWTVVGALVGAAAGALITWLLTPHS